MTKKELAQKRNWNKFRLEGQYALNQSALTLEERVILDKIHALQKQLLNDWDRNSKALGLKVVKYEVIDLRTGNIEGRGNKHWANLYKDDPDYSVKKITV